jgi:hypothetical protein
MGDVVAGSTGDRSRPGHRVRRVLLWLLLGVLVLALAGCWYVDHRLVGRLGRVDGVFDGLTHRPADDGGTTLLMVLEDRDHPTTGSWLPGRGTATTVLLVSVSEDRRHVVASSMPLAARFRDGQAVGDAARRSPSALVGAVERGSGRRVDHLVVVDLDYVRTRADDEHGLEIWDGSWVSPDDIVSRFRKPATDAPTAERQLEVLDPLMQGTLHQVFRRDPRQLWSALDLMAEHTAVDSGWSGPAMGLTALSLRDLRSANIHYVVPTLRCDRTGCTLPGPADRARWDGGAG